MRTELINYHRSALEVATASFKEPEGEAPMDKVAHIQQQKALMLFHQRAIAWLDTGWRDSIQLD